MANYYDILGIDPTAGDDEIRDAYTFQVKVFHPDKYDPAAHPRQHTRALQMTQRLNEARDTLLDPAARARHDQQLSGLATASARRSDPPAAQPHSRLRRPAWMIAGLILIGVTLAIAQPGRPSGRTLGSTSTPTPTAIPCPSGTPTVSVSHVEILPDEIAFSEEQTKNQRLYIVTGTIINTTTANIAVSELGFYLGSSSLDLPPQWTQSLAAMNVEGDPDAIEPGQAIAWTSKGSATWPVAEKGPHPANVTASLDFPYGATTKSVPEWLWTSSDSSCPEP